MNANGSAIADHFPATREASSLHRVADLQFALHQVSTVVALLPGYSAGVAHVAAAGRSHGAHSAGLLVGLEPSDPAYDIALANPYGLTSLVDPRIDAAILLSPQGQASAWSTVTEQSWNALTAPVLIVTGAEDLLKDDAGSWESRLDILRFADMGPLYGAVYDGATHGDLGGASASPALTASIAALSALFLDATLNGDAAALAAIASPQALVVNDPLLASAFERAGPSFGGTSAGSGYTAGSTAADTLFGLHTDDTIEGSAGGDQIDGGGGLDRVDYLASPTGAIIDLSAATSAGGDSSGDSLTSIEGVAGSAFADSLTGNAALNFLSGGAANDTLEGGASADTLNGGAGLDVLDDGTAFDTVDYTDGTDGGVNVNVINGVALTGGFVNSAGFYQGGVREDTILNLENINGTDFDDRLIAGSTSARIEGRDGDDYLYTFSGNDTMYGGAGDDFISTANSTDLLFGEAGNDTLNGGTGFDTLNGGTNSDTADYSERTGGVNVNLINATRITGGALNGSGVYVGGFTEDSLVSIENIVGSNFGDRLVGLNAGSRIDGRGGSDNIATFSSADTLIGGAGADTLAGGAGADTFEFAAGFGADRITDFAEGAGAGDVMRLVCLGAAFDSFGEVIAAASQSGGDVVFNFGGGNTITVLSATVASFAADDFAFG